MWLVITSGFPLSWITTTDIFVDPWEAENAYYVHEVDALRPSCWPATQVRGSASSSCVTDSSKFPACCSLEHSIVGLGSVCLSTGGGRRNSNSLSHETRITGLDPRQRVHGWGYQSGTRICSSVCWSYICQSLHLQLLGGRAIWKLPRRLLIGREATASPGRGRAERSRDTWRPEDCEAGVVAHRALHLRPPRVTCVPRRCSSASHNTSLDGQHIPNVLNKPHSSTMQSAKALPALRWARANANALLRRQFFALCVISQAQNW